MARILTIHSFQQGTGRSTIVARLAVQLAIDGHRVGLFEADLLHPSLCRIFGLPDHVRAHTANHYLRGECPLTDAALDLTPVASLGAGGALFIVPASAGEPDLLRLLREGFEAHRLNEALRTFAVDFDLDFLLIDAPVGENEASLVTTAICDTLLVVLRLDKVDYLGSGIVIDVARHLKAPSILLLANRVQQQYDERVVRDKLIEVYHCDVGAVIPESNWMSTSDTPLFDLFPSQDPAAHAVDGLARLVARR